MAQHHHPDCDGTATQVDHVTEYADGGTDDPANLAAVNAACNLAKMRRAQALRRTV